MIKICFPPGCYGNYISRSLYYYTNLRLGEYSDFTFDEFGSSHVHRYNAEAKKQVKVGHIDTLDITSGDQVIAILPCIDHTLDYYNNQFNKHSHGQIKHFIEEQLPSHEIIQKLKINWGLESGLIEDAPSWILREFFSMWITDCFANGYNTNIYSALTDITITTQDIFTNFLPTIHRLCNKLNLQLVVDDSEILKNHTSFLEVQSYHNSQINCNAWVNSVIITDDDISSPCQTLFDEAYTQHLFRERGYEIQCDGLNIFPTTSAIMKKLIYKI
jgi:hypothetical protein